MNIAEPKARGEHITGPTKESVFSKVGLDEEGFGQAWPEADVMQTTKSNEWGIFLKMATTKGSIFTHDIALAEKMDAFIAIFSKRMGPARAKEERSERLSEKKRDDKKESSWRKLLLGKFGSLGKGGGIMASLGGLLLKGGKALGAGMGDAGKWVAGAMAGKFALGKLFKGMGPTAAMHKAVAASPGFVGPPAPAAAGMGAKVAAATGGRILPWGQGAGVKSRMMPGGAGMMGNVAAVAAPLAAAGMALKDGADLMWSMEERWAKGRENVGGLAGTASGALIGGILGSVVPVFGTMIGAGVGGIIGNLVGEMIGKKMDKAVDKRTRAQLTALGRRYDDLTKQKEKIMASELSLAEKKRALNEMDVEQLKIKAEAAMVQKRQDEINAAEERQARLAEQARLISIYDTYKEHFKLVEGGYSAVATDAFKALERDRLVAIEAETAARTKYQEENKKVSEAQDKANLDALVAAQMEVTRIKDIQKELGGSTSAAGGRFLPVIRAQKEVLREAQEKFLENNEDFMAELDIQGFVLGGGHRERVRELEILQSKLERGADLSEDEQKVADKWELARDEYMGEIDKRTVKEKEEADKLKKQREEGEGVDTVNWEKILSDIEKPWEQTWRKPSGDQAAFHQEGESEADYRKRIGAPTSGVTGGAIYGMPMQGPTGQYYDTTGLSQAPGPQSAGMRAYAAGTTPVITAAATAAVSDTTQAAAAATDKPLWEQRLGKTITESLGEGVAVIYMDEEMLLASQLHNAKMRSMMEELKAVEMGSARWKELNAEREKEKEKWNAQLKIWAEDTDKQGKIKAEMDHQDYKDLMEKGEARHRTMGNIGDYQTMDDEIDDMADAATRRGEIHRQYYGKDKPYTGVEDTLGEEDAGRASSEAAIAGMLKEAPQLAKRIATGGTAAENALIKEGTEIQERIAKSKGWANVYEGSDRKGRKIDQARLDKVKEQLPYAKYHTGDEMDDPEADKNRYDKRAEELIEQYVKDPPKSLNGRKALKRTILHYLGQGFGGDSPYLKEMTKRDFMVGTETRRGKLWRQAIKTGLLVADEEGKTTAAFGWMGAKDEFGMPDMRTGNEAIEIGGKKYSAADLGLTDKKGAAGTWVGDDFIPTAGAPAGTAGEGGVSMAGTGLPSIPTAGAPAGTAGEGGVSMAGTGLPSITTYKMPPGGLAAEPMEDFAGRGAEHDERGMKARQWVMPQDRRKAVAQAGAVSDTTTAAAVTTKTAPSDEEKAAMAAEEKESSEPVPNSFRELRNSAKAFILGIGAPKIDATRNTKIKGRMKAMIAGTSHYGKLWHKWFYEKYGAYPKVQKAPKESYTKEALIHPEAEAGDMQVTLKGGPESGPSIKSMRRATAAVLERAASAKSADAGQRGGDTNVTVMAPTTANSTTTNQNINPNPLMSNNPRTAMGVNY